MPLGPVRGGSVYAHALVISNEIRILVRACDEFSFLRRVPSF